MKVPQDGNGVQAGAGPTDYQLSSADVARCREQDAEERYPCPEKEIHKVCFSAKGGTPLAILLHESSIRTLALGFCRQAVKKPCRQVACDCGEYNPVPREALCVCRGDDAKVNQRECEEISEPPVGPEILHVRKSR